MKIPNLFKQVIKDTFYDKKMEIWLSEDETDDEGAVVGTGKLRKIQELDGNFQFTTREYIQNEYGKEIDANAIVTCESTIAKEGDILIYADLKPSNLYLSRMTNEELEQYTHQQLAKELTERQFTVKGVLRSDSHTTILVKGGKENV